MYNKKSKTSAILAIITAILLIGLMLLLPFLIYNTQEGNGLATIFTILFGLFGYAIIYVSATLFAIVELVFGIKMLKQQSRKRLISYNVRMLITTFVLLPVLTVGLMGSSGLIFQSKFGLFPTIYTIVISFAYIACLIAQIVTIIALKKSPAESTPPVSE